MDRSTRRRLVRAALAIASLVALLIGTTWWAGRLMARSQVVVLPAPSLVAVLEAAPATSEPGTGARAVPLPSEPAHGADEREVCGVGWIKVDADGRPIGDAQELRRKLDPSVARRRLIEALRAERNHFALAGAIVAEAIDEDDRRRMAAASAAPCEGAACAAADQDGAVRSLRIRLADLAAASADPRLYGYALRNCGRPRADDGSCRLLTAAQWARLDPGNAAPWLEALTAAAASGDVNARDEALHRIATADRNQSYAFALPRMLIEHATRDDPGQVAAWLLAAEAGGIETAWQRDLGALTSLCRAATLDDANRRQTCAAVAETMVERSDDLFDRGIGARIGERVGWPVDRTDALRGQEQLYRNEALPTPSSSVGLPCKQVRADMDLIRRRGAVGDAGMLRDWVARSGHSAEQFVSVGRQMREATAEREAAAQKRRAAQQASRRASEAR